jgi:hypothetical protein
MEYQVDQSGKIEDTSKDTVLAVASNDFHYTLKLSSKAKREVQNFYRDTGQSKTFIYQTFAICLFSLLNAYNMKIKAVVIDKEYPGHEELIGKMLTKLFKIFEVGSRITFSFGLIGKKSPAHAVAHDVATRRKQEDKRVGVIEIKKIASYLSPD